MKIYLSGRLQPQNIISELTELKELETDISISNIFETNIGKLFG